MISKNLLLINSNGEANLVTPNYAKTKEYNKWKDWVCFVNYRTIFIDGYGETFGGVCQVGGRLGNIKTGITLQNLGVMCNKSLCHCDIDIRTEKVKNIKYKHLLRNYRIVERELSLSEIVAVSTDVPPNLINISWDLTYVCNYACSYCPPGIHFPKRKFLTEEELEKSVKKLITEVFPGKDLYFSLMGGEPTLYRNLPDICNYIVESNENNRVWVQSNGSQGSIYYKRLIKYTQLSISIHFEFIDEDKLLKVIKDIAEYKAENNITNNFEVRLMVAPGKLEQAKKFSKKLLKISYKNYSIVMNSLVIPSVRGFSDQLYPYTKKELEILNKYGTIR